MQRLLTLSILLLGLSGCVAVPIPQPDPFSEEKLTGIEAGATRSDVETLLGNPNGVGANGQLVLYSDVQAQAFVVFAGGASGLLERDRLLLIQYARNDRVQSFRVLERLDEYCFDEGTCLASSVDLDLRQAPESQARAARDIPGRGGTCSVAVLAKGLLFRGTHAPMLPERIRSWRVDDGPSTRFSPMTHEDFSAWDSEILGRGYGVQSEMYLLNLRPGNHRISWVGGPKVLAIPSAFGTGRAVPVRSIPLEFDCGSGDRLVVTPAAMWVSANGQSTANAARNAVAVSHGFAIWDMDRLARFGLGAAPSENELWLAQQQALVSLPEARLLVMR